MTKLLLSISLFLSMAVQDKQAPKRPAEMTAPAEYKVKFTTSKGDFVINVTRDWAPKGADRFFTLVKSNYFDECRFFRVIAGFMVQFGINGDPKVTEAWNGSEIQDDPVKESNTKGMITFATRGPNTRTTQVFINYKDNASLDGQGFTPFGKVIEGMEIVDGLHSGYGEGAPRGKGPNQNKIKTDGNDYLKKEFKDLDYVKTARVME